MLGRRWARAGVGVAVALVAAVAAAWAQPAAAAPRPLPAVASIVATPTAVPAAGGYVTVRVRVRRAVRCTFSLQTSTGPLKVLRTIGCASGAASTRAHIAANHRATGITIHLRVRAIARGGRSALATYRVIEAAAPPPPPKPAPVALAVGTSAVPNAVMSGAYQLALKASGGTAPYTWTIASGSLPPGLSLTPDGVIFGTPVATGSFPFAVTVSDTAHAQTTASLTLTVIGSSIPITQSHSSNWSGYIVNGGPITSASGTFNVPDLEPGQSGDTAEWVGVDGATNQNLIQAGVAEGVNEFGQVYHYTWWEILPAAETITPLPVASGDQVTVTITQLSPGQWTIDIHNNTSGQDFSINQAYTGPMTSAEWVVEAPTDARSGSVLTFGAYTPNVTFSNLQVSGPETSIEDVVLVQGGNQVSTPSTLGPAGFTVAYGSSEPSPPG